MLPVGDCNLEQYFVSAQNNLDTLSLLRSIFGCLANALQYLHDNSVRHRDIKPQNILVKDHQVFLADFGIAFDWEHLPRGTTTSDSPKTLMYAAPEVVHVEEKSDPADVWSLGCVFLEMVTVLKGKTVEDMRQSFKSRSRSPFYHANIDGIGRWVEILRQVGGSWDNAVLEWVTVMLRRDPTKRHTAAKLFEIIASESRISGVVFNGTCCRDDGMGGGGGDDTADEEDDEDLWEDVSDE